MKPIIFKSYRLFFSFLLLSLLWGGLVYAAGYGLNETGSAAGFGAGDKDLNSIIGLVVRIVLGLLGFVFFGYTLYAGIRWMIARGNNEFVEKAQKTLEGAIIGLIIIMLAYALANLIINKFG